MSVSSVAFQTLTKWPVAPKMRVLSDPGQNFKASYEPTFEITSVATI